MQPVLSDKEYLIGALIHIILLIMCIVGMIML